MSIDITCDECRNSIGDIYDDGCYCESCYDKLKERIEDLMKEIQVLQNKLEGE